MVLKSLKSNSLVVNYETLSDQGTTQKRKQSFNVFPLESSVEDFYALGTKIGVVLKAPPTSIEQSTVLILMEE